MDKELTLIEQKDGEMAAKIAINGFGRIGRNAFKIAFDRSDLEIVAINDLTDTATLAYLLKYDSNYGLYDHEIGHDESNIIVDGKKVQMKLSTQAIRTLKKKGLLAKPEEVKAVEATK